MKDFVLMGVWDHFYKDSVFSEGSSTHYVNLPHYLEFKSRPKICLDDQHAEFRWFDLSTVAQSRKFQLYMPRYARFLFKKVENRND